MRRPPDTAIPARIEDVQQLLDDADAANSPDRRLTTTGYLERDFFTGRLRLDFEERYYLRHRRTGFRVLRDYYRFKAAQGFGAEFRRWE